MSAKRRILGWYFFDWASQPYHTVLLTFVFGPFFAAIATAYFAGNGLDDQTDCARASAACSSSPLPAKYAVAMAAKNGPNTKVRRTV